MSNAKIICFLLRLPLAFGERYCFDMRPNSANTENLARRGEKRKLNQDGCLVDHRNWTAAL